MNQIDERPSEIDISIKGESAKAIEVIRSITGKPETMDVIISALRVYEWILAQQTKGCCVISQCQGDSEREEFELVNYVKDKNLANSFFQGRDIFF